MHLLNTPHVLFSGCDDSNNAAILNFDASVRLFVGVHVIACDVGECVCVCAHMIVRGAGVCVCVRMCVYVGRLVRCSMDLSCCG